MFCSLAIFANKNHIMPRLSLTNIAALNYLLRFEIFVSEDRQLHAIHLILDFEPILEIYQEVGHAMKVGDQRLARIDISKPNFLARDNLPPVVLPLRQNLPLVVQPFQQVLLEATTVGEEIAPSNSSLGEEINKFRFEEEETQGVQVIPVSNAEDKPDRHSNVHVLILVTSLLESTSGEEEGFDGLEPGEQESKGPYGHKGQGVNLERSHQVSSSVHTPFSSSSTSHQPRTKGHSRFKEENATSRA